MYTVVSDEKHHHGMHHKSTDYGLAIGMGCEFLIPLLPPAEPPSGGLGGDATRRARRGEERGISSQSLSV